MYDVTHRTRDDAVSTFRHVGGVSGDKSPEFRDSAKEVLVHSSGAWQTLQI